MSIIPEGLKYSEDHEWVKVEGNLAVVGITDHAQHQLGEIVYIDLPSEGDEFAADEEIANIESVKAAAAVMNPVGGTVAEVNTALDADPGAVNKDPYSAWIYKLKDFNSDDLSKLIDASAYKEFSDKE